MDFRIKRYWVRLYSRLFYWCNLYLFTHIGVQHDFHIRVCSCHLTVTWRVSLVGQEMLTLLEHLRSPRIVVGFVRCSIFYLLWIIDCHFNLFLRFIPLVFANLIKFVSDLRQVGSFLRYNWNIVAVKHHRLSFVPITVVSTVVIFSRCLRGFCHEILI